MKINKDKLILLAAIITPCGLIALALWKAYNMYKDKQIADKPRTYDEFMDSLKKDAEENP